MFSMQIRNSPDFFVARARTLTHSVGSFTGAITPFSVSWSSSSFRCGLRGFAKFKKFKKSKNNLEVGGWVQVSFG